MQYTVNLYDLSHKFDIDIGQELIALGQAMATPNFIKVTT